MRNFGMSLPSGLLWSQLILSAIPFAGGQVCRRIATTVSTGSCKGLRTTFSACQDVPMANLTDSQLATGLEAIIIKGTGGCSVTAGKFCADLGPGVIPTISACDAVGAMCMSFVGGMRSIQCRQDSDCEGTTGLLRDEARRKPCCEGTRKIITGICLGVDMTSLDLAIQTSKQQGSCVETNCYDPSPAAPGLLTGRSLACSSALAAALTLLAALHP